MAGPRPEISVRLIWPFQRVYGQLGLPEAEQLGFAERFDVPVERLFDPDARVSLETALENLELAIERLGRTDLGLLAAAAGVPGDFGPLELAARACATVEEGFGVLASGAELMCDGAALAIKEDGDLISLRLSVGSGVVLPPAAIELILGTLWRTSAVYTGVVPEAECVRFMHPEVPHAQDIAKFFRCRTEFNASENALVLKRAALAVPVKTASPLTASWLRSHVGAKVAANVDEDLVAQIEKQIVRRLVAGLPTLADVAQELDSSERTLHRKLKEANTSYRKLCDEVRTRLAVHYLEQTKLPIKQIAAELGYGDAHAFHRAFKRLTDQTPQQRRKARGSDSGG